MYDLYKIVLQKKGLKEVKKIFMPYVDIIYL